LRDLIWSLRRHLKATVVALVVESEGRIREKHREPEGDSALNSLRSLIENEEIQSRVSRLAQGREDFIRFEGSATATPPVPWHEALFIRLPELGFSQRSSPAFICVVDRLIGRGPDEALTIRSARYTVAAVTSLFRRLEAHILGLEPLGVSPKPEAPAQRTPLNQSNQETVVDSGLGIDDKSVVEEWAPWMQLAHVARLHHELLTSKQEDEPVCRDLLERGWTQGLALRRAIGVDQNIRSGKTALKTVLDWTRFIDPEPGWLAKERQRAGFLPNLRDSLLEVVRAARLELDPTVQLGERSLGCHLLTNIAAWPSVRRDYWLSGAPSDDEFRCAISSIARLVHHIIGGVPMEARTIQAYIWVLSEYAHNVLGLPAQFDLRAHLGLAEREEPALHGLRRFYRNHFFHAMEVCLLGHFLLELKAGGEPLWRRAARAIPPSRGTKQGVLKLWYLTALLHDIGYAVDIARGTADLFQMFGKADILGQFASGFNATIEEVSASLAKHGFQGYSKEDKPGEDHGVVGARHLQALLDRIAKDDHRFAPTGYAAAVRAIALHNSHKHNVRFNEDPLAFLLILCDTLQQWERPAVSFSAIGSEVGAWLLAPESPHPRPSQPFRTARLTGVHRSQRGEVYRLEPGGTLGIELDYGEGIVKNWGVYNLWLSASYNLQRLDLAGLGFNIDLKVTTPFRGPSSSMHSLRDAAHETHMAFLDRWFPNQGLGPDTFTNGYLTYRQGSSCETLTVDLRALAKAKPLTKDMGAFRDSMKRWRRRDIDWDFDGDYASPESLH
jgi:hypothetical protein